MNNQQQRVGTIISKETNRKIKCKPSHYFYSIQNLHFLNVRQSELTIKKSALECLS